MFLSVSVLGSDKFIEIAQRISIKSVRNFWEVTVLFQLLNRSVVRDGQFT